jgi:hypothetical protein
MLGTYFYHEIIRKTVIAFGTLFNNISVKHKADDNNAVLSTIKVPIAYGPIQKFLARIEQQSNFENTAAITLPRLSFEIISYRYDPARKASPITKFCGVDGTKIKKVFMPVPYDIGFRLSFACKLQDDTLQILEQILPFFQPAYTVSVKLIDEINEVRDIPFTLNNISFRDDYEGNFDKRRFIVYDLDFTAKTYFYSELPTDESGGIIKRVQIDYASSIRAPREMRYVATPKATKDYNNDQTTALTATLETSKKLMKVTSAGSLNEKEFIQVNDEVMRIEEIDGTNLIVSRGQYGSSIQEHYSGDKVNVITIADDALIDPDDDFGFNESRTFFQDFNSYSTSQGSDL